MKMVGRFVLLGCGLVGTFCFFVPSIRGAYWLPQEAIARALPYWGGSFILVAVSIAGSYFLNRKK